MTGDKRAPASTGRRRARYTGPRPRSHEARFGDDTDDPVEADWVEPDDDPPAWVP